MEENNNFDIIEEEVNEEYSNDDLLILLRLEQTLL